MIKSPKEKFIASAQQSFRQWDDILKNPIFDRACDYSLIHMLSVQPDSVESHYRMAGAQQFVRILKSIHEFDQEPPKPTSQGLNYQAGV